MRFRSSITGGPDDLARVATRRKTGAQIIATPIRGCAFAAPFLWGKFWGRGGNHGDLRPGTYILTTLYKFGRPIVTITINYLTIFAPDSYFEVVTGSFSRRRPGAAGADPFGAPTRALQDPPEGGGMDEEPKISTDFSNMVMVRRSFPAACVYPPPAPENPFNPCNFNTTLSRVMFFGEFYEDPLIQFVGSACIDYTIQTKAKCDAKGGAFVGSKPNMANCQFMKQCRGGPKVTALFNKANCDKCGGTMKSVRLHSSTPGGQSDFQYVSNL